MTKRVVSQRYGKSRVRLVKVDRTSEGDRVHELQVEISLDGGFEEAYRSADNATVLPTDTMKNTVYALALDHPLSPIEGFAGDLARHFVESHGPAETAEVTVTRTPWNPTDGKGGEHPHTFRREGEERLMATARVDGEGLVVTSGIRDLVVLKTANSGFSGFPRDRYTTLAETDDRLLGTNVTATWTYEDGSFEVASVRDRVRSALVGTFADHDSLSVQHTLFDMGAAVLDTCPEVRRIHLKMPNLHCLLVDLSPFDLNNDNRIFVPIDEPHGSIEAEVGRE